MTLPAVSDYRRALQNPGTCLLGLEGRRVEVCTNTRGEPLRFSGNFAAAFKVKVDGHIMALRCFHRPVPEVEARLRAYAAFMENPPPALVGALLPVRFVAQGIRLGQEVHPVVWMPWFDGKPLRDWVGREVRQVPAGT